MNKLSIRTRMILLPIAALLLMMSIGQYVSLSLTHKKISDDTEKQQISNISLIHDFIEVTQGKSLENYLKGITEGVYSSIESIDAALARGAITPDAAQRNISALLSNRKIGDSGYVYVINSEGILQHHPYPELIGQSIRNYDFVSRQISLTEDYIEYAWANPGESQARNKALYMTYYEPRDWIISISAYMDDFPDLIDVEDLRPFVIEASMAGELTYILDSKGYYLIHPDIEGHPVGDQSDRTALVAVLQSGEREGQLTLPGNSSNGGTTRTNTIRYSRVPDFGWFIVSEIDEYESHRVLRQTTYATTLILFLSLTATAAVLFFLGRSISNRILRLHKHVAGELIYTNSIGRRTDEIDSLSETFDRYRSQLEDDRKTLSGIARFVKDSPMPIIRIQEDWRCIYSNPSADETLVEQLLDAKKDIKPEWRDNLSRCFNGEKPSLMIADSRYLTSSSGNFENGAVYLAFLNVSDSDRYETLQSIWSGVFDHSIEGITITDEHGVIERVNDSFSTITGYTAQEAVGEHTRVLKSGTHRDEFYTEMWNAIVHDGYWEGEIWNRRKNGELYPEWLSISAFNESETGSRKYMAIFHDITQLKNQERIISRMESIDKLTQLPNRDRFYSTLNEAFAVVRNKGGAAAVAILDIDSFAQINGSLGTPAGDAVLKSVSQSLAGVVRGQDFLARIGGDEFGIILSGFIQKEGEIEMMDQIKAIFDSGIVAEGRSLRISASAGLAFLPSDGGDADSVLSCANAALRRAKSTAKGTYVVYDASKDYGIAEDFEIEVALRDALPNQELYLEYQPVVSSGSQLPSSFEALIRWKRKDGSIVPPDKFISKAEATGLIIPMGQWVIDEACRMVARFDPVNAPRIAVNISAKQFSDPSFFPGLKKTIERHGIDKDRIALEITENIAAADVAETTRLLEQISSEGFRIAIDDFGTGYSSLKYIRNFSFDILKIDKSFVQDILEDEGSLAISKAVISMGHALGKSIIAEGVEDELQFQTLKELGCDCIQGYYFSRPLRADDAIKFWTEAWASDSMESSAV